MKWRMERKVSEIWPFPTDLRTVSALLRLETDPDFKDWVATIIGPAGVRYLSHSRLNSIHVSSTSRSMQALNTQWSLLTPASSRRSIYPAWTRPLGSSSPPSSISSRTGIPHTPSRRFSWTSRRKWRSKETKISLSPTKVPLFELLEALILKTHFFFFPNIPSLIVSCSWLSNHNACLASTYITSLLPELLSSVSASLLSPEYRIISQFRPPSSRSPAVASFSLELFSCIGKFMEILSKLSLTSLDSNPDWTPVLALPKSFVEFEQLR